MEVDWDRVVGYNGENSLCYNRGDNSHFLPIIILGLAFLESLFPLGDVWLGLPTFA